MAASSQSPPAVTSRPFDLYPNAFSYIQPRRAHDILMGRLKSAKCFNEELADYFRDRCAIEDQYIRSLLKLSKKPSGIFHISTSTNEEEEISGGMSKIKEVLQSELIDIMNSHSKFQTKVQTEVESSFRDCKVLGHSNWINVRGMEDQLNIIIKNYEECEAKCNKSKSKLGSSSNIKKIQSLQLRLSEDQKNLNQAKQLYLDQAPRIYRSYQTFDSDRLVNLIETLTKFETLQADHSREKMDIFETSMMKVLNFDCRQEMERFALRNGDTNRNVADVNGVSGSSIVDPPAPSSIVTPTSSQYPTSPATDIAMPAHHHTAANHDEGNTSLTDTPLPDQHPTLSMSPFSIPTDPGHRNTLSSSTSTYDPNHASIPKLSTPNVSIPVRSDASTAIITRNDLPSRDLYVQRQSSIKSMPRLQRSGSTNHMTGLRASPSSLSINHTTPKPSTSQFITDKIFTKSRLTNILSRSSGPERASSQLRQTSETSSSPDQLTHAPAETVQSARPSHGRSSSLVNSSSLPIGNNLYDQAQKATEGNVGPNGNESGPSVRSKRLSLFPSNIISKRKASRSAPSIPSPSPQAEIPPLPPGLGTPDVTRVDAEGFTIPPEDRDRKPWETRDTNTSMMLEDDDAPKLTGSKHENPDSESNPVTMGSFSQFAIKPSSLKQIDETDSDRLAAIQRVQNTLVSASIANTLGGSMTGNLGPKRRSTTGLRGRRVDGRGVTMYDSPTSQPPVPNLARAVSTMNRGKKTDDMPLSALRDTQRLPDEAATAYPPASRFNTDLESSMTGPFTTDVVSSLIGLRKTAPNATSEDGGSIARPSLPRPSSALETYGAMPNQLRANFAGSQKETDIYQHKASTPTLELPNTLSLGLGGTNPFLNRSFSPSASSPTFNYHTSSLPGMNQLTVGSNEGQVTYDGLTAMVRETLNVLMDQGQVTKVMVLGEVRFIWPSLVSENVDLMDEQRIYFEVQNHDRLEKVICPTPAVTPGTEGGEYVLNLKAFKSLQEPTPQLDPSRPNQTNLNVGGHTVLKYRIYFDGKVPHAPMELANSFVPLKVIPRWRAQKTRTELMLTYEPNASFHQFLNDNTPSSTDEGNDPQLGSQWRIENFEMSTTIYNPDAKLIHPRHVTHRHIKEHQEIPRGVWDEVGNEMKWSLNIMNHEDGPQRVIGRFIHPEDDHTETSEEVEPESIEFTRANCGPVQVRWQMRGASLSGIKLKIIERGDSDGNRKRPVEQFEDVIESVVTGTFLAR